MAGYSTISPGEEIKLGQPPLLQLHPYFPYAQSILWVESLIRDVLSLAGYRCRALFSSRPGVPVVLLHGYMFTSDVWDDISVLGLLEEKEIPFLAMDMPYGMKSKCSPKSRSPSVNVGVLREAVHGLFGSATAPVIVGASLGGYIALRYAVENPVSGLLLIAPVHGLEEDLVKKYRGLTIPVYIIYGTRDRVVGLDEMEKLASLFRRGRLIVYDGAEHPAYLSYPCRFKEDLLRLYSEAVG